MPRPGRGYGLFAILAKTKLTQETSKRATSCGTKRYRRWKFSAGAPAKAHATAIAAQQTNVSNSLELERCGSGWGIFSAGKRICDLLALI
jgi:hypothetical protein